MSEKINHISKLFLVKKRVVLISLLIFLGVFVVAKPANAIFGIGDVGLFDLPAMQLDALDFVDNIILRLVIFFLVLLAESQALVVTSAALLQWAVSLPINLSNTLVLSGWNFISGLTNLFFILIFVAIALAFILKTETLGMKKALPNLIIVALLVNFSLVFVGIFVDIADIFRNALINTFGGNLVSLAIEPLRASAGSVIAWLLLIPTTYLVAALIPYGNVIAAVGIGTLILTDITGATGGILLNAVFLMVLNFILSGIFFLYFALFLLRIVFIWILAIFAPLAFLAYILPATKKYFDQWFRLLLSWSFLGIVAFFLLGLGLKLFAITGERALLPWGGDVATGRGTLPSFIYNYLFLIIYLGVAFYISKKFVPQGVNMIMTQAGALITKTVGAVKRTRTSGEIAEETAERLAAAAKWSRRLEERTKGKAWAPFVRSIGWATRRAETLAVAPLTEYGAKMRRVGLPTGWKQMSIPEKERHIDSLRREQDRIVLGSEMKGEGTFQKAGDPFRKRLFNLATKFAEDTRYAKEVGDIIDAFPNEVTKEIKMKFELASVEPAEKEGEARKIEGKINDIVQNITAKAKVDVALDKQIDAEAAAKGLTRDQYVQDLAAGVLHARELKPKDVQDVAKSSLKSVAFRFATQEMTSAHMQRLVDTFDKETVENVFNGPGGLNTIIKSPEDLENLHKKNRSLVHFFAETPAGRAMNWEGLKYMLGPNDQPTNKIDVFGRRMRIEEALDRNPVVGEYYRIRKEMERLDATRQRLIRERAPRSEINQAEQQLMRMEEEHAQAETQINADENLRNAWQEIERLRKPPQQRQGKPVSQERLATEFAREIRGEVGRIRRERRGRRRR